SRRLPRLRHFSSLPKWSLTTMSDCPASFRLATTFDPMNPAPPVTKSIPTPLVSRFRSSYGHAAASYTNFGIEGHRQVIDSTWLRFRTPQFGLATLLRTSEPPHEPSWPSLCPR